jgi:hypothetical protein
MTQHQGIEKHITAWPSQGLGFTSYILQNWMECLLLWPDLWIHTNKYVLSTFVDESPQQWASPE